jgi:dGTPase
VTQVASVVDGFVFHSRLTHTLEMSQLGRRLAEKFNDELQEKSLPPSMLIDPDVVEAACLAHDLGHPPFGHTGESALDEALLEAGDNNGFEGNAQSFRIVSKLEPYRPHFPGFNLTRGTLNAMLKYPRLRHRPSSSGAAIVPFKNKWGVYDSEKDILEWAREPLFETNRTLEASIMDLADDIAYSVHDLHDFFRAGLIPASKMLDGEGPANILLDRLYQATDWADQFGNPDRHETKKVLSNLLSTEFKLKEVYSGSRAHRALLREITSNLIKRFRDAAHVDEINGRLELSVEQTKAFELFLLRQVTMVFVHESHHIHTDRLGFKHVVKSLFQRLASAVVEKDYYCFPPQFRKPLQDGGDHNEFIGLDGRPDKLRIVADFIGSLTDDQAIRLYKRLFGLVSSGVLGEIAF